MAIEKAHEGSSMRSRIAQARWEQTPLGPMSEWPASLRTTVGIVLGSRFPMLIWWGPRLVHIYNDAYAPILGDKHPAALGQPAANVWGEIWDVVGPMAESVLAGGEATWSENLLLLMNRHGSTEEAYFTFSYSPAPDDQQGIGGVLVTVQETTAQIFSERQLRMLAALSDRCGRAESATAVAVAAEAVLQHHRSDVPFSWIYLNDGKRGLNIVASHGVETNLSPTLEMSLHEAATSGAEIDVNPRLEVDSRAQAPAAPLKAIVLELLDPSRAEAYGYWVAGKSSLRPPTTSYTNLFVAVADRISASMTSATTAEEERRRLEALAEIDRAKTIFFTNISHEFRTPLTLLLGPIEEALKSGSLHGEELELAYRNARRLLRLVNGLLDFARIQAGRLKEERVTVDLGKVTRDLVAVFRSAAERSGLALEVEAPQTEMLAEVDLDMYEKIVSNLLSNAIKFTREGHVQVVLRPVNDGIVLSVTDTGIGIAVAELPRLFERFHRIDGAWSRTQEGSGIGLALVKDLVALQGGSVTAENELNKGTSIRIRLPNAARLDNGRISEQVATPTVRVHSVALANEAAAWAEGTLDPGSWHSSFGELQVPELILESVLVVDDNADMRAYLTRLLSRRWTVRSAFDGVDAMESVGARRPDLVVSDVMMPRLDGFGLTAALKGDAATRSIPIVLVSARAGEEARIEALQAGADDYVVKPFSARELVARIEAQLLRARLRSVELLETERLTQVFEQAPVGIAVLHGKEHIFEFANDAYSQLVDRRPLQGLPVREALPEMAGQGIYELLDSTLETGKVVHRRSLRLLVADSRGVRKERFFDFVYQPTVDQEGRAVGIVVVVHDVSELTEARRAADSANRAKDEFLAMLGHELRNPLSPITTTLHMMRMKAPQVLQPERAVLERQVNHLVRLVDDLLDVSRIASGKLELLPVRMDLRSAVAVGIETASPALKRQRHNLILEQVSVPLWVKGDPARLAQVVANLLVNASKFTPPEGEIRILVRRIDKEHAEISVTDNGIGISAEMLPQVFDTFSQERQSVDRSSGGLGLGLAIVRSLVQGHGGYVAARSEGKGKGSTFEIVLPLAVGDESSEPNTLVSLANLVKVSGRVLVVDDNQDAAEMLAFALAAHGLDVQTASDGPKALEVAQLFRPDLAVLDIGLPVMDGYELARLLKLSHPSVFRIALTGYLASDEADRAECFEARLLKPVDFSALLALLESQQASVARL